VSDIDTATVDGLKALDPNRPIREADIPSLLDYVVGSRDQCRRYGETELLGRQLNRKIARLLAL
jgi:hypothetical protein